MVRRSEHLGPDGLAPLIVVDHHVLLAHGLPIGVRRWDLHGLLAEEAVTARHAATVDVLDSEGHDLGAQERHEPADRPAVADLAVGPAHRLGEVGAQGDARQDLGEDLGGGPSRLIDSDGRADALLRLGEGDLSHVDALSLREALQRLGGAPFGVEAGLLGRPLDLHAPVWLLLRQPLDNQDKAPWRASRPDGAELQAPRAQRRRHLVAQLLQRRRHEAGGQFLGADLEQEVAGRHHASPPFWASARRGQPASSRWVSQRRATWLASLRTRPMRAVRSLTETAPRASSRLKVWLHLRTSS